MNFSIGTHTMHCKLQLSCLGNIACRPCSICIRNISLGCNGVHCGPATGSHAMHCRLCFQCSSYCPPSLTVLTGATSTLAYDAMECTVDPRSSCRVAFSSVPSTISSSPVSVPSTILSRSPAHAQLGCWMSSLSIYTLKLLV